MVRRSVSKQIGVEIKRESHSENLKINLKINGDAVNHRSRPVIIEVDHHPYSVGLLSHISMTMAFPMGIMIKLISQTMDTTQ